MKQTIQIDATPRDQIRNEAFEEAVDILQSTRLHAPREVRIYMERAIREVRAKLVNFGQSETSDLIDPLRLTMNP